MTALALLAGASLGLGAAAPAKTTWLWLVAALLAVWACSPWRRCAVGQVIAMLLAGMAYTSLHARTWEQLRVSVPGTDARVLVEGRVLGVPERWHGTWRFDLDAALVEGHVIEAIGSEAATDAAHGEVRLRRMRLQWRAEGAGPRAGERWRLLVRLLPLEQTRNFVGGDAARHAFRDGVHGAGRVLPSARNQRLSLASQSVQGVRARIATRVHESIADPDASALVTALAVGLTGGLSLDQWRVFNATGTTHLVAISGLHVTLFAWLAFRAARGVWRWLPPGICDRAPFAYGLGLLAALGYSLLAGLSVPTLRTWLMLAFYVAGRLATRHVAPGRLWSLALIGVLAMDPLAPLAAGFWLSFVAVGVLMFLGDAGTGHGGLGARAASWLRLQVAVTLALAPLCLAVFGSGSSLGVVVNLVAIPLVSFLFVPVVLAGALAAWLLPEMAPPIFALASGLYDACWPALAWCADLPSASWRVSPPPWWYVLGTLAVGVGLCRWPLLLRMSAACAALPLWFTAPASPPRDQAWVDVLDAGRGSVVLVRTRTRSLLFDTGEAWQTRGRRMRELVLPALDEANLHVDVLLLPALDEDRAAAAAALWQRGVGSLIVGGGWTGSVMPVTLCRDSRWAWDGVQFESIVSGDGGACHLRVASGAGSMLLAGELDAASARERLSRPPALEAGAWVVTPRGDRDAVLSRWIEAAGPALVVAAGGVEGAHSRARVLEHWGRAASRVLDTHRDGAVRLSLDAAGVRVRAVAAEARYPFVWRRALRYDPAAARRDIR
jgi:competence protein ComEC